MATKSYGVIGDYKTQIQELKKEVNSTISDDYLSKEQIEDVFNMIDPKNNAPLLLGQFGSYANWIQYMSYHKDRTQKLIQKVFIKMPFLDSKLVQLLAEIDDCTHFRHIESTLNLKFANNNMSAWAGSFYEYSIKCKELEEYNEKNLSKYKP